MAHAEAPNDAISRRPCRRPTLRRILIVDSIADQRASPQKNSTPNSIWKISALNDGLEPIGFELLARTRCGLIVRIWPDLNAKVFVRAGWDDKCGEFFLLQGLRQRQRVILMQHGSDLKHDRAFRNQ